MSNKTLCTCGKEHGRDQPVVITITTCPKKKHHPYISTTLTDSKKPPTKQATYSETSVASECPSQTKLNECTENNEPTDHLLLCEDEGVTITSKIAERPLIDNSAYCDLDNEGEGEPSDSGKKVGANRGSDKDKIKRRSKEDKVNKGKSKEAISGKRDKTDDRQLTTKSNEAGNTFFDPSHVFESDEQLMSTTYEAKDPSVENAKSTEGVSDKPSKVRWQTDTKNKAKVVPCETKDEINNFPSDNQMKLPILIPRYHGPGCTMEVDVLEKHGNSCRYRKTKNPERNPADDRSGSYEVIGRLTFKTCHPLPEIEVGGTSGQYPDQDKSHSAKVATIYSLFNIPHKFNARELCLSNSHSHQDLQKYLRRKKILQDLAKSSKSFPSHPKKGAEEVKNIVNTKPETKEVNFCHTEKVTSYEVEVLYFCGSKCNKSVQISERRRSRIRFRKWIYYIFPCITVEESHTVILNEYSDTGF